MAGETKQTEIQEVVDIKVEQSPSTEGAKKTLAAAVLIPDNSFGSSTYNYQEVTPQLKLMAKLIAQPKAEVTEPKDAKDLVAQPAGKAIVFAEGIPNRDNVFKKGCVVLTSPTVFGEGDELRMTTYVGVDSEGVFAIQGKDGATYPEGTFQKHMESILEDVGNQESNFVINQPNLRTQPNLQILNLSLEGDAGTATMRILANTAKSSEENPLVTSRDRQVFEERNRPVAPIVEQGLPVDIDGIKL